MNPLNKLELQQEGFGSTSGTGWKVAWLFSYVDGYDEVDEYFWETGSSTI